MEVEVDLILKGSWRLFLFLKKRYSGLKIPEAHVGFNCEVFISRQDSPCGPSTEKSASCSGVSNLPSGKDLEF